MVGGEAVLVIDISESWKGTRGSQQNLSDAAAQALHTGAVNSMEQSAPSCALTNHPGLKLVQSSPSAFSLSSSP